MNEEYFLRTIRESKQDPRPLLVYVDWLEERGDLRAEFLRLVYQLIVAPNRMVELSRLTDPVWVERIRLHFEEVRSSLSGSVVWPLTIESRIVDASAIGRRAENAPREESASSFSEYAQYALESDRRRAVDLLDGHRERVNRVRAMIGAPTKHLLYEAMELFRSADSFQLVIGTNVRDSFKAELTALRAETRIVAESAQAAAHEFIIRDSMTSPIYNVTSVKSICTEVDRSIDGLRRLGRLRDEMLVLARESKERAARYRWQKKQDEASVTEAGGSPQRAERLRREATVLLSQDWSQVFPGESAPI